MDFSFLYNSTTNLMAIGYNVSDRRLDASCYDLLASEARLASFVGIAQGQFPQEHWFALGRQLCVVGGEQLLLSWSGSMFEYLMPCWSCRPTRTPCSTRPTAPSSRPRSNTAASAARRGAFRSPATTRSTPTSITSTARSACPGTGMKRGLGDDLVIAPYATMMGLMVDAEAATENLQKMAALGFMGKYGFYEAVDYTAARLPRGQEFAVVRSFMAHHQGMGFLAMSYLLHDRPMQRRFEADPLFQATMLVLQERVPKAGAFQAHTTDTGELLAGRSTASDSAMPMRIIGQASTAQPEVQLLSNGRYHVMVTSSGGSYSRWKDLAVTRWREDATTDNWGNFCYVRDVDSGAFWSTTYQPTLVEPKKYEVIFSEGRAEFRRQDRGLELYTEIVVSPEDDIELRRTRITNKSAARRTIELTSYAEVVMAPAAADNAHPAFSKLFVQTEILRNENAILCTRRPRTKDEHMPFMLNLMTVHDGVLLDASFETSRAEFIGRTNSTVAPARHAGSGAAGRQRGFGARPHRRDPLQTDPGAGPDGDRRRRHRHDGNARSGPAPDRQIPGPPPGRPRVRTGLDPQPGGAAPAERQRSRCAVVQPPGQFRDLPEREPARRSRRPDSQSPGPVRPVGVCHFGRPADRPHADQ